MVLNSYRGIIINKYWNIEFCSGSVDYWGVDPSTGLKYLQGGFLITQSAPV